MMLLCSRCVLLVVVQVGSRYDSKGPCLNQPQTCNEMPSIYIKSCFVLRVALIPFIKHYHTLAKLSERRTAVSIIFVTNRGTTDDITFALQSLTAASLTDRTMKDQGGQGKQYKLLDPEDPLYDPVLRQKFDWHLRPAVPRGLSVTASEIGHTLG
jgi:hypothetical protein